MKREGRPRLLVLRATVLAAVLIAVVDPTSAWAASAAAHGSPHQIGADPHQIGAKYLTSLTGPGAPGERSDVGRPSSKDVHTARLLVRFHRSASPTERAAALRLVGGRIDAELAPLGVVRIAIDRATDVLSAGPSAAEVLARHAAVEFAEPDRTVRLAFEPDDEFYGEHPDLDEGQWGIAKAKVDDAWDTVRGAASVTVAILDTGADPTHPDLVGALVRGNTFVTDPDDECVPGTTRDDNSHGTHVAGVVGASGDNGIGIAGVAFGVKVMPVKVLDCTGQGNLSDVARGLVWAIDNGARIVNLSLGSTSDSPTTYAICSCPVDPSGL